MGRTSIIAIIIASVCVMMGSVSTQFHGRNHRSSSSSSAAHSTSFNRAPGADYHALGIQQPSAHALGQRTGRYWWQNSNSSPFQEGAAKKVGIRASSFGADPPRAHSRPAQDLRQQAYPQQQQLNQQGSYTGTAGATFSSSGISGPPPPPFPGCAAALKCVDEKFCNMTGFMVNEQISPELKPYRVALMPCLNTETNTEGFCCRDPLYEDPWPADMPMPGMAPKPIAAAPTVNSFVQVAATPNRPPTPTVNVQPSTGYPSQPPPVPSFPIPQPQTSYLPPVAPQPAPVQPVPTVNYAPPQPAPQPSVPAPTYNQVPPSPVAPAPQAYQPTPPPPPQQPWTGELAPVTPHPGCAAALKCVPEEMCNLEGIMVNTPVRLTPFEKEYLRVPLMNCLNTETNQEGYCCRDPLYEDPWPADMPMPGMNKPVVATVTTNAIAPVPQQQTVYQPQPAALQQSYLPPPAVQQPQPIYQAPAPVQQPAYQPPAPVQQQQQQQTFYNPPAPQQQPAYTPPVQQPNYAPQPSAFQQTFKPYEGPLAADVPYPGCAAALKCVQEQFCNMEGVMVDQPVSLTPLQKEYRVPMMSCLNVDTNQVGFCCRDPNYEDPWPADMPMPGMAPKQG